MSPKPVVPSERARQDLAAAVRYYRREAGEDVALDLVSTIQVALQALARRPGAGSPRYGQMIGMADLRSWPLGRYPYLVFYVERVDQIDVWRILHTRRDLAARLGEPQ